jgi:hypothetical protein
MIIYCNTLVHSFLHPPILFSSIFNMDMLFDFVITIFKNHMFKVGLSRIHQNTSKAYNLQNKLQVDKILDFPIFNVVKCACTLPTFHIITKIHQTSN